MGTCLQLLTSIESLSLYPTRHLKPSSYFCVCPTANAAGGEAAAGARSAARGAAPEAPSLGSATSALLVTRVF